MFAAGPAIVAGEAFIGTNIWNPVGWVCVAVVVVYSHQNHETHHSTQHTTHHTTQQHTTHHATDPAKELVVVLFFFGCLCSIVGFMVWKLAWDANAETWLSDLMQSELCSIAKRMRSNNFLVAGSFIMKKKMKDIHTIRSAYNNIKRSNESEKICKHVRGFNPCRRTIDEWKKSAERDCLQWCLGQGRDGTEIRLYLMPDFSFHHYRRKGDGSHRYKDGSFNIKHAGLLNLWW